MRFRYIKVAPKLLRPIIPLKLKYEDRIIITHALIDSGADNCVFESNLAEELGLSLREGKKGFVAGLTGKKTIVYFHKIELVINGYSYTTEVGFTSGMSRYAYGVLGQLGFFDHFKIRFSYNAGKIELRPEAKMFPS